MKVLTLSAKTLIWDEWKYVVVVPAKRREKCERRYDLGVNNASSVLGSEPVFSSLGYRKPPSY